MKHIMNEDLFPSHKDAVIANQRRLIAKFKEYDKQRSERDKELVKEINWLREENRILQDKLNGKGYDSDNDS